MPARLPDSDSQLCPGGAIPGTPGAPAFRIGLAEPSPLPVLIAVPHAGRNYPRPLLRQLRHPEQAPLRLEDRLVDRVGRRVAQETGAALLVAEAPRVMIDLNRGTEDIDWDMFPRGERPEGGTPPTSGRARGGLGLIPRRVPGLGELWKQPQSAAELRQRIAGIHAPYHAALAAALEALRARWGAALLIDLHSMPPLGPRGRPGSPDMVIGDRFGASCQGAVVAAAFAFLGAAGCPVAHNRPYAGGYVLDRHARPGQGVHAVQIELDRSIYLDSGLSELGRGFDATVDRLCGLVRHLAAEVADLGENKGRTNWPEAAQ